MPVETLSKLHYFCHIVKRVLVTIIALVYFAVSSGFSLHLHYCMGHFVDASFTATDNDDHQCAHCGMTKKKGGNGCCKDEHKIVKSDTDHSLAKEIKIPAPAFTDLAMLPAVFPLPAGASFTGDAAYHSFQAHAPPDRPSCPVFLKIRNLRI